MPNATLGSIEITPLPTFPDPRGTLTVAEIAKLVPFTVQRLFYVQGVPEGITRGSHGHYRCRQFLICQTGIISVEITDGIASKTFSLHANQAILIEPGLYATETYTTPDAALLVLCDRPFEAEDYIKSIEELVRFRAAQAST